ncbi:SRPBCC family protein [Micromonospora krabiensis]|nr:SRPBCC family protein [Micromonospora krabiensis]
MGQEMPDPADIRQDFDQFSLRCDLLVPAAAERAFEVFTGALTRWWVVEYTWSGPEALAELGMEPRSGGMLYEIGPYGFRGDWGRVLTWDPPRRLVFTWQIGPDRVPVPDPARASEVEVLFLPEAPEQTRVELEHRHFDRHGEAAEGYRQALTAGWHELLSRYVATVDGHHPPLG